MRQPKRYHDEDPQFREGPSFHEGPSTRRHIRRFLRPFYKRPIFWLALLAGLVIAGRLALDPLATHYTRQALENLDGYRGRFGEVAVGVLPPRYTLTDLEIIQTSGGRWDKPLLRSQRIVADVDWRQLLHRHVVARVRIDRPRVDVIKQRAAEKQPPGRLPDIAAKLRQAPPVAVERIEIRNGEVLYQDRTTEGVPELWLHDVEVAVENVATRPELAGPRPVTVTARAILQRSGVVTSFLTVDPHARGLTFAGRTQLRGLNLAELYQLITPKTDVKVPAGTADLFAEYRADDGALSGGVKSVLKTVEVRPTDDSLGNRLKAWLADEALDIFSDRVPGGDAVATTIPIRGRVNAPDAQVLPTVLGIIRNAFVEGLASGFANLPPAPAANPESTVQPVQVNEAVRGDRASP